MPNCVDFDEFSSYFNSDQKIDSAGEKFNVTFIGSLFYPPNRDAVDIIVSTIAPHFSNDVQFLIVGKNPPDLHTPDNVHFLGYVDDIKQTISQSDICIAPLRFGGSTRIKILEYMAMKSQSYPLPKVPRVFVSVMGNTSYWKMTLSCSMSRFTRYSMMTKR